jgi:glycine/D-amino acid oxidase-like deaminating enzyme
VGLSFDLHQQLATAHHGDSEWDYRRVRTVSVSGNVGSIRKKRPSKMTNNSSGVSKSETNKDKGALPDDLQWLSPDIIDDWEVLGHKSDTAQVHPWKFTTSILRKAVEAGAELIIGKVTSVQLNSDGEAVGVSYTKSKDSPETINSIQADKVVLTMGPWTSRLLPSCPISGLRAHSITIQTDKQLPACGVFTELRTGHSGFITPEVYPRKDEVYVCGEGDTATSLPDTVDEVEVVSEKCDDLFQYAGQISPELSQGRVQRRQACYLPIVDIPSCSGPFIGKTTVPNLLLASGHSCWGINNAPATGLLMSEIILDGGAKSASLEGCEPWRFFDAKDVVTTTQV